MLLPSCLGDAVQHAFFDWSRADFSCLSSYQQACGWNRPSQTCCVTNQLRSFFASVMNNAIQNLLPAIPVNVKRKPQWHGVEYPEFIQKLQKRKAILLGLGGSETHQLRKWYDYFPVTKILITKLSSNIFYKFWCCQKVRSNSREQSR